jgi:D-glycero-alpha-D-manno-heptose 1-phosphate guanylyltransferase
MSAHPDLSSTDVVILCGGLGSRLSPVLKNTPKGLALVGDKPFLDILTEELYRFGFRRFIFCVGHLSEKIISHFRQPDKGEFLFSKENIPLGTGGAIKHASSLLQGKPFLVINGDSFCQTNYFKFLSFHDKHQALFSMVLSKDTQRKDGGSIELDNDGQIISFKEKTNNNTISLFINAGIYMMQPQIISLMPQKKNFSLEYDVFPQLIESHPCFGFISKHTVVDIGTPERLKRAKILLNPQTT